MGHRRSRPPRPTWRALPPPPIAAAGIAMEPKGDVRGDRKMEKGHTPEIPCPHGGVRAAGEPMARDRHAATRCCRRQALEAGDRRRSVVLPQPLGPSRASNWPCASASETPFDFRNWAKVLRHMLQANAWRDRHGETRRCLLGYLSSACFDTRFAARLVANHRLSSWRRTTKIERADTATSSRAGAARA